VSSGEAKRFLDITVREALVCLKQALVGAIWAKHEHQNMGGEFASREVHSRNSNCQMKRGARERCMSSANFQYWLK
jgi:hypothetical protein